MKDTDAGKSSVSPDDKAGVLIEYCRTVERDPLKRRSGTIACPPHLRSDTKRLFPDLKIKGPGIQRLLRDRSDTFIVRHGPLAGFHPDLNEPASSLVLTPLDVDGTANLRSAMSAAAREPFDESELTQAQQLTDLIVETGLSRWNNLPALTASDLPVTGPFQLVLVDQGDEAGGDRGLAELIEAAKECRPELPLLIWHRSVPKQHVLQRLTLPGPETMILPECQLAPLLQQADAVHVSLADAGLEAILHGCDVHCHATAYYSGFGRTVDHFQAIDRHRNLTADELAAAALIRMPVYLDLHNREIIDPLTAAEQLLHVRSQRMALRERVFTFDMPYWRRRAVTPFLIGPGGKPAHLKTVGSKLPEEDKIAYDIAIWGADDAAFPVQDQARLIRLEDGFLRSSGLGAALNFPGSLFRVAGSHLHYDARGENDVTKSLLSVPPTMQERSRADALRQRILDLGATKYMQQTPDLSLPQTGGLKVLVVGQVEDDASLRYGAGHVKTNDDLIEAVKGELPDAFIAYRDHPDVAAGFRNGRASRTLIDADVTYHPLLQLFEWADELHTITSLAGFEALLRGVKVTSWGWPFYAGWGLTTDKMQKPVRGKIDITDLIVGALIRCPAYVHPKSRMPCSPEELLTHMDRVQAGKTTWDNRSRLQKFLETSGSRIEYRVGAVLSHLKR